jgi:bifunctional oligoribonuclease and PAP phosphatase NrnA
LLIFFAAKVRVQAKNSGIDHSKFLFFGQQGICFLNSAVQNPFSTFFLLHLQPPIMKVINELYRFLSVPHKVVITTHQKPDPDAMGSSLGLYHLLIQLGHEVQVISPTNWAAFLNWMPGCGKVLDYEASQKQCDEIINRAEWIFCLDFNALNRTKRLATALANAPGERILIDHHREPQTEVFAYGISDITKSSTCEMVYDFIVTSGHAERLNHEMMQCLYAGVMGDTGSFRFASATASVFEMVAHFKQKGLEHTVIHDNIYDNFLENRFRFIGHVLLHRMEVDYELNTALIAITKQDLLRYQIKTGDTEGLVNYPLGIQGIKLAALVIDRDEKRKWSFRSKGEFDCNTFARQHFNGGGHYNAAGGESDESLDANVKLFKEVIYDYKSQLETF